MEEQYTPQEEIGLRDTKLLAKCLVLDGLTKENLTLDIIKDFN